MPTLYLSHTDCEKHVMLEQHPESPARLRAIQRELDQNHWNNLLERRQASEIDDACFAGIHPRQYLDMLAELKPGEGIARIDADTSVNKHSLRAARLAAGSGLQAVEAVIAGHFNNAFCAVRPPGHHAEAAIGMGFCIFNSIALAAERALSLGAERIAILDFDVHHGNGTVDIFMERPEVLVCSSFQFPFYPGRHDQVDRPNICLTPLSEGTASGEFRQAIERDWLPALAAHRPDIILVSAGFDAHREDPLAGLLLSDSDYLWLGEIIREQANRFSNGRLVSMLEGGYNTEALARSVAQYLTGSA
ncbi:MAG: histone deacetylase family protein [Halieaceae bacterium]|jgi:acetoin utilization deacetylase AcuC-like enzyme|nr:histone deacetylase family protein [Halieaceae bacterium]